MILPHQHRTYLELVNLALLVILELVNVLLQLLDLGLGLFLPSVRRLDRFLEIGDGLLQSFDVGANLKNGGLLSQGNALQARSTYPRGIATLDLLFEQMHLMLFDLKLTRKFLPLLSPRPAPLCLVLQVIQTRSRFPQLHLSLLKFLDFQQDATAVWRGSSAQRS